MGWLFAHTRLQLAIIILLCVTDGQSNTAIGKAKSKRRDVYIYARSEGCGTCLDDVTFAIRYFPLDGEKPSRPERVEGICGTFMYKGPATRHMIQLRSKGFVNTLVKIPGTDDPSTPYTAVVDMPCANGSCAHAAEVTIRPLCANEADEPVVFWEGQITAKHKGGQLYTILMCPASQALLRVLYAGNIWEIPVTLRDRTINLGCDACIASHIGTSFMFGFMTNYYDVPSYLNDKARFDVYVTAERETDVRIRIPFLAVDETRNVLGSTVFQYSNQNLVVWTNESFSVQPKGIEVTSNLPISVYSTNLRSFSTNDGSVVLPEAALGNMYILNSYPNGTDVNGTQAMVASLTDGTDVTFHFPDQETISVTLDKYDVFQISTDDVMGTMVTATHPVNVQIGNKCANIPNQSTKYCSSISSAIPPVGALQSLYIVPAMQPRRNFTIGIVAPYDGTDVKIYDADNVMLDTFTLDKQQFQFLTYYNQDAVVVNASQAVMVTQYGHGSGDHITINQTVIKFVLGDPSLAHIPAPNQYTDYYSFLDIYDVYKPSSNYSVISVVIDSSDDVAGLRLNGNTITTTTSSVVQLMNGLSYDVIYFDAIRGEQNTLTHINAGVKFGAFLCIGWYSAEVYTTLGLEVVSNCES